MVDFTSKHNNLITCNYMADDDKKSGSFRDKVGANQNKRAGKSPQEILAEGKKSNITDMANIGNNLAKKPKHSMKIDLAAEKKIVELLKIVKIKLETPNFIHALSVEDMQVLEKEVDELCTLINSLSNVAAVRYSKYLEKILHKLEEHQEELKKQTEENKNRIQEDSDAVFEELERIFAEYTTPPNDATDENNEEREFVKVTTADYEEYTENGDKENVEDQNTDDNK